MAPQARWQFSMGINRLRPYKGYGYYGDVYFNQSRGRWEAKQYQSSGDILTQHQSEREAKNALIKRCEVTV